MEFKGNQVTVKDKRGIELFPGDFIAMGFRSGNSGEIRVGKILRYLEYDQGYGKPNCYLEIEWVNLSGYEPKKPTRVFVTTDSNVRNPTYNYDYWKQHEFVKILLPEVTYGRM